MSTVSGTIQVDPVMGLPAHTLTYTYEVEEKQANTEWPCVAVRSKTQAEEVWSDVQAYYPAKGKDVPLDEAKACLADIKKEKEEQKKGWLIIGTGIPDAEYYAMVPPAYGTPEFWRWHAKRKASQKK